MRMQHIAICSLSGSTIFFHVSHLWQDFRETLLGTKYVLFSLQLLSETFLTLRRIERNITINVPTSLLKVPVILLDFN